MTDTEWYKVAKDVIQALAWIGAVTAAIVTAFKAISEIRENRRQREEELRWKQANLGRELMDNIFKDAYDALLMLDYYEEGRAFEEIPGPNKEVKKQDILDDLNLNNMTSKNIYIRERLERLFFNMERLEYFIDDGLVKFDDVSFPSEYYVCIMAKLKKEISGYLSSVKYRRALIFLDRFPDWAKA